MAGWRIGMVAADAQVISEILKVKSQMDSGMFKPLQLAAVQALARGPEWFTQLNDEYRSRRVLAGRIFDLLGAEYDHKSSGMFLWGCVGERLDTPCRSEQPELPCRSERLQTPCCSEQSESPCHFKRPEGVRKSAGELLSDRILHEAGVFITPGFIFGNNGEDYIRISLCAKPQVLEEAYARISGVMRKEL
jgi:aspartate/methionine/tyrosine aminotransferase